MKTYPLLLTPSTAIAADTATDRIAARHAARDQGAGKSVTVAVSAIHESGSALNEP
jgi:hypothetical protein